MSSNELQIYSSNMGLASSRGGAASFNCVPVAVTASQNLTLANMLNRVITCSGTAAIVLTPDNAATIIAGLSARLPQYSTGGGSGAAGSAVIPVPANQVVMPPPIGTSFQFLINNAATSSGSITFGAATGNTYVYLAGTTILVSSQRLVTVVVTSATTVTFYA